MPAKSEQYLAVAFGSNIGDRRNYLDRALNLLDRVDGIDVVATSRLYESAGWGREDLDPFLNAVCAAKTTLGAREVLLHLQRIENKLGRQREVKWGPRTLDLDLLAFGDESHNADDLQLPHPWIGARPFVYLPFGEVADLHPAWRNLIAPTPEALAIEKDSVPLPPAGSWGLRAAPVSEMETITNSEEETLELGRRIAATLLPGDVVALDAPMGSGKSVVARGIARGFGITGPIQSPTYTLCRNYEVAVSFEHWDFYRLGSIDDLESTGFFAPESAKAIRAIEWAELFPEAIKRPTLSIRIAPLDADRRRITINSPKGLPFALRVGSEVLLNHPNARVFDHNPQPPTPNSPS